jgi:hypothetical protein
MLKKVAVWKHETMTIRVYLAAAQVLTDEPQPSDLPAERVFIHATDLPEVWVETESKSVPDRGRAVCFALARPLGLGFERISGTVERTVAKTSGPRSPGESAKT